VIAVTGATGGVGSRVLRFLAAGAGAPPLVALARRPEAVAAAPGLTARRADYDDPPSLERALAGVERLVFVSSDDLADDMRRHHANVVEAAVASGVRHVVYTSIVEPALGSAFYYAPVHRDTEALLASRGLGHCLARTSIFADFFTSTWTQPALAEGELALPAAGAGMALVTRDDVARALARLALAGTEGSFDLTGPAALTGAEIAAIAAAALGRPLAYRALEHDEFARRLVAGGAPDWLVEAFTTMFAAVREGGFARVSGDVEALTGRPATGYAEFVSASAP
jgi:NAD(P)H dehydrogenase (quinone)